MATTRVEGGCVRVLGAGDCDPVLTARRVPVVELGAGVDVVVNVAPVPALAGRTGHGVHWSPSTTRTSSRLTVLYVPCLLWPSNMICNKNNNNNNE